MPKRGLPSLLITDDDRRRDRQFDLLLVVVYGVGLVAILALSAIAASEFF